MGLDKSDGAPRFEQLGPYKILSRLGVGGMGEVYRARDTRLDREVAIKVLPEAVVRDPERIKRLRREARVAASLNHANVAAIYGFEDLSEAHFLVMELVEGRTLADRLKGGPMPIDEALAVVEQIAEGLEAAHENGVIHRDLKPANVKLTPAGRAKILDFGLAKALDDETVARDLEHSPTVSVHHTTPGMIVGTAPYMSPEQARGRPLDKRSDIWSLGCLLFECLSGHPAFEGDTITDVLAKVLEREPDWDALPARTPPRVRELIERCLEKDLRRRVRDAGDVRIELERAREAREWSSSAVMRAPAAERSRVSTALPWGVAALAIVVAIAALLTPRRDAGHPAARLPMLADVTDPDALRFPTSDNATVAITADGGTLAYVGRAPGGTWFSSSIYVRRADEMHAVQRIDPPDQGWEPFDPFFSPDGKWLGFMCQGLYKVAVGGGRPVLLAEASGGTKGATWSGRGIIFSPAAKAGLALVGENGGAVLTLTVPDGTKGEVSHRWPSALPDGRHVLFTIKKEGIATFDEGEIALLDLDTKKWTTLFHGGSFARYVPTGHIVFTRDGSLLAVPFDLRGEKVTGTPVPVLAGVMTEPGSGAAQFAVASDAGALLYVPGGPNIQRRELVWLDRRGGVTPVGAPLEPFHEPWLSPDGTRLAVTVYGATDSVAVYDFARGSLIRAKTEGNCRFVYWHPDGRQLLVSSDIEGGPEQRLFLTDADGGGAPRRVASDVDGWWTRILAKLPDGFGLVHLGNNGILLSRLDGGPARPITGMGEVQPRRPWLSPDGRWLAYDADVSGREEVYARPFPSGIGVWQISRGGGVEPRWTSRGGEIVYVTGIEVADRRMVSARVTTTPTQITVAAPVELFKIPVDYETGGFDLDGQRMIAIRPTAPQFKGDRVVELLNWFDQVRSKAPTR